MSSISADISVVMCRLTSTIRMEPIYPAVYETTNVLEHRAAGLGSEY